MRESASVQPCHSELSSFRVKRELLFLHIQREVQYDLNRVFRFARVIVNVRISLQSKAITHNLLTPLTEGPDKVLMWRIGIVNISSKRQGLSPHFGKRCMLGTGAPAFSVCPVFFTKGLRNIGGDHIDDRLGVGFVQSRGSSRLCCDRARHRIAPFELRRWEANLAAD